ncbi:MAG TPA: hypothetical protein PLS49_07950, partial [Candidatus Woesebacteria bacterium]|nr:hypothetical protein [Candidatus Woesebacteria bacterium]
MIKIVKRIVAIVLHNKNTNLHRASVPMWHPKYPIIGFISAVVLFLTIFAIKDYVKAIIAFKENKTPSPFLHLIEEESESFPLPEKEQLAQVLGDFDNVKALIDAHITFNFASTFTAPVLFEENITAPNIVYEITAGEGITISGDPQRPVISVDVPEAEDGEDGISSIEGLIGDIDLEAGANIGINIEGNKIIISNTASIPSVPTQLTEAQVEAYIFDNDNTGTLSSGTLALSDLSFTGTLSSDYITLNTNGGLATIGGGLSLIQTCSAGQILKWNGTAWICASDSGSSAVIDIWEDGVDIGSDVDTLNFVNVFDIVTSGAGTIANIDIRDNSLNFSEFADVLVLDGNTSIKTGNTEVLFFGLNGRIGVNNTNPGYTLDVNGDIRANGNLIVNNKVISDLSGIGLTIAGGSLQVNILNSVSGVGDTSSYSGLQFVGNQLSLLQGCAHNEVLAWDNTNNIWRCSS